MILFLALQLLAVKIIHSDFYVTNFCRFSAKILIHSDRSESDQLSFFDHCEGWTNMIDLDQLDQPDLGLIRLTKYDHQIMFDQTLIKVDQIWSKIEEVLGPPSFFFQIWSIYDQCQSPGHAQEKSAEKSRQKIAKKSPIEPGERSLCARREMIKLSSKIAFGG